jgi:hypothetical protein
MGFEEGSPDSVGFEMYGGEDLSFPRKEGESQEMAILNGLFNDVEGKVDEETKMQYYKLLIPQVYKNGEISKKEYDAMIQEIIVNKAKGGIANLRKKYSEGSSPGDEKMTRAGSREKPVAKEFDINDLIITLDDKSLYQGEPIIVQDVMTGKYKVMGNDGRIIEFDTMEEAETYKNTIAPFAKGGIANLKNGGFPDLNKDGKITKADVLKGRGVFNMGGGVMDLGGMEKDYRFSGGFVPIGEYEKKDDVPARLSKNEFVFTADAVRAAGGGSINKGAKRMYDTMKKLEAKPTAKRMTA